MRCPNCDAENEEGAAFCTNCAAALTAYSGYVAEGPSARTLRKAAHLAVRPPVIAPVTAANGLLALFGPIASLISAFTSHPVVNSEGTNYIGAAFGAVGAALSAIVLLPMVAFLLIVAWGAWSQKSWAWMGTLVVWAATGLMALTGMWPHAFLARMVMLVAAVTVVGAWLRRDVKDWYGAV